MYSPGTSRFFVPRLGKQILLHAFSYELISRTCLCYCQQQHGKGHLRCLHKKKKKNGGTITHPLCMTVKMAAATIASPVVKKIPDYFLKFFGMHQE